MARDDSVIRGSLIACMIFLVLSIALNFFLWFWGDTQAIEAAEATERLSTVQSQVAKMETLAGRLKAMLGRGGFSQAEIDEMKQNAADDPDMQAIEEQFSRDMSYFGPDVEPQNRNYPALPQYLVNAVRDRNIQVNAARDDVKRIQTDAEADVNNARTQQKLAETQRDDTNKKLVTLSTQFDEDRARMIKEKEDTKDMLNQATLDFNKFRKTASDENNKLVQKTRQLQGTIDTQKLRLNEILQDKFESTQGEIRYVVRGGNLTTINLGSADALRPGITFGVIDADETRLQDAKVKATIQVTKIQDAHLAEARVVARPEIRNPIIPGDKIFSPFWAPGRVVKIALAGDIDIDGDGRPDNEAIKGQIKAAGAEVAAEVSASGAVTGNLDASIRFLVIGESPEVSDSADLAQADAAAQAVAAMGSVKAKAAELGLTIIPAWKLDAYLKTIDDTLTTPLGSAVRGADFPPESVPGSKPRLPSDIAEIYQRQTEGVQKGNDVLPP
jgi:enamine deaminase RidA (YjgF/YER057c/UK114 family)